MFVCKLRKVRVCYYWTSHVKRSFYSAVNGIFGKVLHFASEDVILQLIVSKCMPILLYGLDACPVNKTDLRSLDFTVFGFKLPSVLLNISSDKFIRLYDVSDNVVCTSLRVN